MREGGTFFVSFQLIRIFKKKKKQKKKGKTTDNGRRLIGRWIVTVAHWNKGERRKRRRRRRGSFWLMVMTFIPLKHLFPWTSVVCVSYTHRALLSLCSCSNSTFLLRVYSSCSNTFLSSSSSCIFLTIYGTAGYNRQQENIPTRVIHLLIAGSSSILFPLFFLYIFAFRRPPLAVEYKSPREEEEETKTK